jgi:hypothetical protein
MAENHQIQYLTHTQIDKLKWDACIDKASNGLIYAYSVYLDTMAGNWNALIYKNYEAVMPLTWKRKYGINYLYQPAFTASLGVFGNELPEPLIKKILDKIPSHFKFIEISLNAGNKLSQNNRFDLRSNYILNLNNSYDELSSAYRENHSRNIKKAFQTGCEVRKDIGVEEIIRINREQMNIAGSVKETDYEKFRRLFYLLKEKKQAETYGIVNEQKTIMASCVFFYSHNRAYYILVGNTPDGKTIGASHALIDAFIKDNAAKDLILDFEGSDIRNLAFFYSGFGAKKELYPFLKINRLPFYMKWFKK